MNIKENSLTHGRTSVYNLNYHIIWCTKYRNKVLVNAVEADLKAILNQIALENGYVISNMEVGLDDHVHLLVSAPPKIAVSTIVKQLKGTSSLRLFKLHPELAKSYWKAKGSRSLWSPSYYVESVGDSNQQAIDTYITNQKRKE